MQILGDYHTHTIYSHGKGTILENAEQAKKIGLKEIAITDHGYGHKLYGVKKSKISEMRANINEAEERTGVKTYLGMEANLASSKGDIDLTMEELADIDILLVGFHRFVKCSFKDFFGFFLPNMLFKKVSKKQREQNTEALLLAMDKYPIDVITHPKYGFNIDLERVAKKAVKTGTYLELNQHKMCFTKEDFELMNKLGVKFIINSDAHELDKIGKCEDMLEVVKKYNIPPENVVNLDKIPTFKMIK